MSLLSRVNDRYAVTEEPLHTERRLELVVLILMAVVLAQVLVIIWSVIADHTIRPVVPAVDSMQVSVAVGTGSISAADSAEVQARPLFWASRRPLQSAETAVEEVAVNEQSGRAAPKLKQLTVTGVFGHGTSGGVIVTYKGKQERVLTGDTIDGWTLESVAPGEAVFVSGGAEDVRRLLPKPVVLADAPGEGGTEGQPPAEKSPSDTAASSVARSQPLSSVARTSRPKQRDK